MYPIVCIVLDGMLYSLNAVIDLFQSKAGAVAVVYDVEILPPTLPSFIDLLLQDPNMVVDAVDSIFKQANE